MTADELRELSEMMRYDELAVAAAAAYIRACADALEAGPVAWRCEVRGTGSHGIAATDWRHYRITPSPGVAHRHKDGGGDGLENRVVPLYPVAMPGALRLPKPMTEDEIEEICWTEMDRRLLSFARAIESETLRRVKEANE